MGEIKKKNNRERILHHDTNATIGVIFGPRCAPQFKEKIELILRDNRYFSDQKHFYSFNTELSHQGEVVISSADKCLCDNQLEMRQKLDEHQMRRLLFELQIHSN